MFRASQPSFGAGILSPSLQARVDLAKYPVGLKDAYNMVVHAHGGASNRAGFMIVAETKGSAEARQIPFVFDVDTAQTYQIVFTNLKARIIRSGSPVLETAKAITGVSSANPAVITSVAHGFTNGDEIFVDGVVGPIDLNGRNFVVRNVTADTFELEDMFYGDAVSSAAMPAYVSGGTARRVYEIDTPYVAADLALVKFIQEKDVIFFAHKNYPPRKLSRFADDNWVFEVLDFLPDTPAPTGIVGTDNFVARTGSKDAMTWRVSAVGPGGEESAGSVADGLTVQYSVDDGRRIKMTWNASAGAAYYNIYRTDANVGILVTTTATTVDISSTQYIGDGTAVPTVSDVGSPPIPTGFNAVMVNGEDYEYAVSAISGTTGEESFPSTSVILQNALNFKGNKNVISWSAVPDATSYIVYRKKNGRFGYVGQSETLTFTDENIVPDLSQGPQDGENPFVGVGNYPRTLTFFEQRLGFFSPENDPSAANLGQSGNYENFSSASPATARDAISFRIRSREKNVIKAAIPMQSGLALFTTSGEWIVSGGSEDFLTPSNVKIRPQTYRGISDVDPIVVGNIILFPQARGCVVRDFSYDFANDNFTGNDLTLLCRHLFKGKKIKSWAYAQSPDSIVWVVLNDGSLVSLTYMREHEVWAWTRHASEKAYFEDVSVTPEGEEDVPYFVVRRTFGNVVKRYIEKLHTRDFGDDPKQCFFVDSGLTYEGAAATIISGLWHLEGQAVWALADGNKVGPLVVSNGKITLPNPSTVVHVGLKYDSYLQTLDVDMGSVNGMGTVQGRKKTIGKVIVKLEQSRGVFTGQSHDNMTEWKQRQFEAYNAPVSLHTGIAECVAQSQWDYSGSFIIKQDGLLPMTVLSVAPDVQVGG